MKKKKVSSRKAPIKRKVGKKKDYAEKGPRETKEEMARKQPGDSQLPHPPQTMPLEQHHAIVKS